MMIELPEVGKNYKHWKGGSRYRVVALAKHEAEGQIGSLHVVYTSLDASNETWIRPVGGPSGWCEPVLRDGWHRPRFEETR